MSQSRYSIANSNSPNIIFGVLRRLASPSVIVHVGGAMKSPLTLWHAWDIERAVLVNGEAEALNALNKSISSKTRIASVEAVLSDKVEAINYYTLSLSSESGVISADALTLLWPSITNVSQRECVTSTLDTALSGLPLSLSKAQLQINWLLVESLIPLKVLQGGVSSLELVDVICLRVCDDDVDIDEAKYSSVVNFLASHGFEEIVSLPSSHPKLRYVVFCKRIAANLTSTALTLIDEVVSLKTAVEQVSRDRDEVVSLNASGEQIRQELESTHQKLLKAQQEVDTAKAAALALQNKVDELETIQAEHNRLKAENDELQKRQQLMNEELVKAEGQILLIKDLLLREQGI